MPQSLDAQRSSPSRKCRGCRALQLPTDQSVGKMVWSGCSLHSRGHTLLMPNGVAIHATCLYRPRCGLAVLVMLWCSYASLVSVHWMVRESGDFALQTLDTQKSCARMPQDALVACG